MNPFAFLPIMAELHQEELRKEANQLHLLNEAHKTNPAISPSKSKLLALVGRELASIGLSLEVRFSEQPDLSSVMKQQGNPGGCS